MSIGLTVSFDYGKVALDDIESERIHYSYGGGIFVSPFDLLTIHVGSYLANDEEFSWLVSGGGGLLAITMASSMAMASHLSTSRLSTIASSISIEKVAKTYLVFSACFGFNS